MAGSEVMQMSTERPVARFRAGSVSCAVWENEFQVNGEDRTMLKASIARRYRDKDGEWKSSGSFSRNEIPLAIWCLEKAFDVMLGAQDTDDQSNVPVEHCTAPPFLDTEIGQVIRRQVF